mmetsp:Transcript_9783/g.14729  ORF Transcript_9783/g.14729 Transcript_9783/m.14729 type:complete len:161 (+) Transcript_9783:17-499(+)
MGGRQSDLKKERKEPSHPLTDEFIREVLSSSESDGHSSDEKRTSEDLRKDQEKIKQAHDLAFSKWKEKLGVNHSKFISEFEEEWINIRNESRNREMTVLKNERVKLENNKFRNPSMPLITLCSSTQEKVLKCFKNRGIEECSKELDDLEKCKTEAFFFNI